MQDKTKIWQVWKGIQQYQTCQLTPHYKYHGQFRARQRDSRNNNGVTMSFHIFLVLNFGSVTTFWHPEYTETILNISFASEALVPLVQNWRVLEDYCRSDHQYVPLKFLMDLNSSQSFRKGCIGGTLREWTVLKFDEVLVKGLDAAEGPQMDGSWGTYCFHYVASTVACEVSVPQKKLHCVSVLLTGGCRKLLFYAGDSAQCARGQAV